MIDLHTHSTASDGSLTPAELARAGKAAGLDVMALTDHDLTKGLPEFLSAASSVGLVGIPGVELSAEVPSGQLHLVGLGFRPDDAQLNAALEKALDGRASRNAAMLKAFNDEGIHLTEEEVRAYAGDDLVSRVHFAMALQKRGLAIDLADAFAKYLGKGALCYRERFRYSPAECIRLIKAADGMPVMAHPLSLEPRLDRLESRIAELADLGLEGMECYYSAYDTETTVALLRIARHLNLIPSVGSDFHGTPKPTVFLGRLPVPAETEARLRLRLGV